LVDCGIVRSMMCTAQCVILIRGPDTIANAHIRSVIAYRTVIE